MSFLFHFQDSENVHFDSNSFIQNSKNVHFDLIFVSYETILKSLIKVQKM